MAGTVFQSRLVLAGGFAKHQVMHGAREREARGKFTKSVWQ